MAVMASISTPVQLHVYVSSQVYNKLQMVYTQALRSLTLSPQLCLPLTVQ